VAGRSTGAAMAAGEGSMRMPGNLRMFGGSEHAVVMVNKKLPRQGLSGDVGNPGIRSCGISSYRTPPRRLAAFPGRLMALKRERV
jgi:hypothetical protein